MSQVTVRTARVEEIPILQEMLARQPYFEYQDLTQAIVHVAEYEGKITGMITGRIVWQVPTLLLEKDKLPRHAQRRATLLLIRSMDAWLADRSLNRSGIYTYFCVIKGSTMKHLANAFGMLRLYKGFATYGKDLK